MPDIQNFSVPAGNQMDITFDVGPDEGTLDGAQIDWKCWVQQHGCATGSPIISKSLGSGIEVSVSYELTFIVTLDREDTLELTPGNYFHEAQIIDSGGNYSTVTQGVMTILETEIR